MIRGRTLALRPTIFVLASAVGTALTSPAAAQDFVEPPLRDALTFQLALTLKSEADQSFLLGSVKAANELYSKAKDEAKTIGPNWGAENSELVALLTADIDYRLALLENNADFWGGVYSLSPISPVEAYLRFESAVTALTNVTQQIEMAKKDMLGANLTDAKVAAVRAQAKTEGDAQALEKVAGEVISTHHAEKAATAEARISQLIARQKELVEERKELAAKYEQAHREFDNLVMKGVLSATGLPPDLAEVAASDKPLQDRLLQLGKSAILNKNSDIGKAFAGMSDTTARIAEAARSIDEAKQKIDSLARTANAVQAAVRRGTLEGALEAGTQIYSQLSKAEQDQLKKTVVSTLKPVAVLMETAQRANETRMALAAFVTSDSDMRSRLFDVIDERTRDNVAGVDRWYRVRLVEFSNGEVAVDETQLLKQVVRAWPNAFFKQLPADVRASIRAAQGVADDATAAHRTLGEWPPRGLTLRVDQGKVTIDVNGKTQQLVLRDFVKDQASRPLEAFSNYAEDAAVRGTEQARIAMQNELSGLLRMANDGAGAMTRQFAGTLADLDNASSLTRVLPEALIASDKKAPKADTDKLFDDIWKKLPAKAQEVAAEQLAKTQAGAVVSSDVLMTGSRSKEMPPVSGGQGGQGGIPNEAVLKAAITAACPAAGVAFLVADALKSLGQMASLSAQINAKAAEDRSLMKEQLTLNELIHDERAAIAIAEISVKVAETRRLGALRQVDSYDVATLRINAMEKRALVAQRLFMPRAFLIAEQLRFRFDQLDRSLAFWIGDPSVPRGRISSLIKNDPQWIRYALDSDIRLYEWLERGNESDRGSMVALAENWNQKLLLASTACDKFKCKTDTRVMGEVVASASPELSLKSLVNAGQWRDFQTWKEKKGSDFSFEFLLTPELLVPDKNIHLLRLVDVRLGSVSDNGTRDVQGANLSHPGMAYVPLGESYIKEHYLPDFRVDLTWKPFPDDLRSRWIRSLVLKPMEGYGLYTLWRLTINGNEANWSAKDFVLQFAYQFQKKLQPLNDLELQQASLRKQEWNVRFQTADGLTLRLPLSELGVFGSEDDARKQVDALRTDPIARSHGLSAVAIEKISGDQR